MQETEFGSWEEFEEKIIKIRNSRDECKLDFPLLFRGHSNSAWPLKTTLERNNHSGMPFEEYYRLISSLRPEIESLAGTVWEVPAHSEILKMVSDDQTFSQALNSDSIPACDYMAYLRHHGFPSPLLDWTKSLYVAAYFAFRSATESKQVSIFVLDEGDLKCRSNWDSRIYRPGGHVKPHKRHFLQQSCYTMCLINLNQEEWRFAEHETVFKNDYEQAGYGLTKINIPASERLKVLKKLDEHNLNAFSLFGSEESLMETLSLRELHYNKRAC
ncbi:MAG: FRG domain-containing protein [Alphaproteobacteria bacterium]|nr:FRG domain-containing protein [Alphaproteobacteria bacterium]